MEKPVGSSLENKHYCKWKKTLIIAYMALRATNPMFHQYSIVLKLRFYTNPYPFEPNREG